ncbi:MAG: BlaI/MecI/CopY family transcriptional regulator [Sedimentisphaerales bacterium]|jgi:BlaI family penicillinase repressor
MAKGQSELTAGEWAIIQAVWDNEPCAAPTIQEELEKKTGWSYSTVKTMMDRMVAKGLLTTRRIRNLILYSSVITKKEAQKGEIMRAVKRAFGGAMTPMMQFLLDSKSLTEEELDQLEAMIKSKKEKAKK